METPIAHGMARANPLNMRPVAFAFKGDVEEEPSEREDDEHDLESDFENVSSYDSPSLGDGDYSPTNSKTSDLRGPGSTSIGFPKADNGTGSYKTSSDSATAGTSSHKPRGRRNGGLKDVARNGLQPPAHAGPSANRLRTLCRVYDSDERFLPREEQGNSTTTRRVSPTFSVPPWHRQWIEYLEAKGHDEFIMDTRGSLW